MQTRKPTTEQWEIAATLHPTEGLPLPKRPVVLTVPAERLLRGALADWLPPGTSIRVVLYPEE